MDVAKIKASGDAALAQISNALDDLEYSPDQRPVPLLRLAMDYVRDIIAELGQEVGAVACRDLMAAKASLLEIETYFEEREDVVDGDYGRPAPNREMTMLRWVREVISFLAKADATNDVFEASKAWPEDIRKKLSAHDLRRMGGWAPRTKVGDWRIDTSAGGPILVYQDCSVIESEQAHYVLSLIERDSTSTAHTSEARDAINVEMTPHMQTGTIDGQAVERAITAAMRQGRIDGFGLCSDKWDTSFPTRSMWLAALNAAFGAKAE